MKPHFDPELPAPEPLDDSELKADEPIISSGKPIKRPLWDQPKVQVAVLAIFAILGLTWKMSGSSTQTASQPRFTATEPVTQTSSSPVRMDTPAAPEPLPVPPPSGPSAPDAPDAPDASPPVPAPASAPAEPDSLAGEVSRALNSQQVYSEKTRDGLKALSRRLDHVEQIVSELQRQRQEPGITTTQTLAQTQAQPTPAASVPRAKTTRRSAGQVWPGHKAQINSLYPGLAWVTWKGSSWALRPGDRFAGATVLRIDESKREVVTSSGVIR
ncbi:hypothetical protein LHY41_004704 [Salmonella enterica]|nr:hypothetical protein [Salmonella enterica]